MQEIRSSEGDVRLWLGSLFVVGVIPDPGGGDDISIQYVLDRFVGADRYTINCLDPTNTNDPTCLGPKVDEEIVALNDLLTDVTKRHILRIYRLVGGNKTRAAEMLQMSRTTLREKLRQYGEV